MITHLCLIDAEHEGVEYSRWQIVAINLPTIVRWLNVLCSKHEEVAVGCRWYSFIEERATLECLFLSPTHIGLSCLSSLAEVHAALVTLVVA